MQLAKVIAHRGASSAAPENTLVAMLYAKKMQATWVEFDVMLTQDSVPIVLHDVTLERTSDGQGSVEKTPYSMIRTLDAGSWFDKKFRNEKIPNLEEMIDFLIQHELKMNIEIKPVPSYEIQTTDKVMDLLIEKKLADSRDILLSSFSFQSLLQARKRHASVAIGLLLEEWPQNWLEQAKTLQCTSIHLPYDLLSKARVQLIKEQGYLVLSYTVDNLPLAEKLFSWGVDSIFTNVPDMMIPYFKNKESLHMRANPP